ncbi:MAG: BolA family protein [Mariprofundaceae bacterium]
MPAEGGAQIARIRRIQERLEAAFDPVHLEIEDESARHAGHAGAAGGGGHFRIIIVSPAFAKTSRLAAHRLIHRALADMFPHDIHALAIRASAPTDAEPSGKG